MQPYVLGTTLGLVSLAADPSPISGIEVYWNTSIFAIRAYNGTAWVTVGPDLFLAAFMAW